jgi:tetratricopeptide (TPR) repeat protein
LSSTAPQPLTGGTRPNRAGAPRSLASWWWIALPGAFLALLGVGIVTGYVSGVSRGEAADAEQSVLSAQEQFDLGVEDLLAARYELARQRFEYILSLDPSFPGAAELLDRALQAMNVPTGTPTLDLPTPTPRPTLDISSLEGIYQQAVSAHSVNDWTGTLEALLAMRRTDPLFRLVEVNVLMASALRNRGVEKILDGDQEQGIYDLALAERFGPLDGQASSWRNTAAFYMYANSYFGIDWEMATELFRQACAAGVWDTCYKFAWAARKYGDYLITLQDPCEAAEQYGISLQARADPGLEPTATKAVKLCLTATFVPPTGTVTETPTPTPTLEPGLPTETPTPPAPPTDTPMPTDTPAPTETPTP